MTEELARPEGVEAHETSTSIIEAAPAELGAGSDIALKVKVSCSSACDLRGRIVKISAPDAVVKEMVVELTDFDGAANETAEFVVKAPFTPGRSTWTALFPAQEKEGLLHEESSAAFSFVVKPHATSMAVWDVPSPIVFGTQFKIKAGVKCFSNCQLATKKIEIYDQEGDKVASATLGGVPWSTAGALFWTEVELEAPSTEGYFTWEAKFPEPGLKLPHEEASFRFSFGTARPPEHMVTLEVTDQSEKNPLVNADVLLRPLKVPTDESGVASVDVPEGTYEVYVTMDDYKPFKRRILVDGDETVEAELLYWRVVED